jgi:hypothetical protein
MRKLLVAVAVAACFGVVQVSVANAAPCGTLTSSTTLSADCEAPLTIGASGISVNLNGHSVVCNSAVDGIVVPSTVSFARVVNGRVVSGSSHCVNGINVGGDSNRISSIAVHDPNHSGVMVGGSSNRLIHVSADHALVDDGFTVFGSFNVIGFGKATNNGDEGVGFFTGSDNTIFGSLVAHNGGQGVISGDSRTKIFANRVSGNNQGIYLSDNSTGSFIFLNAVFGNTTGIEINNTSSSNQVTANVSLQNGLDMSDDNANCDANVWFFNLFNTRNQPCIH